MPGGVLATSGEVGKASEEACGVLTVSNKIAPAAIRGVRAAARPAIKWERSPTASCVSNA